MNYLKKQKGFTLVIVVLLLSLIALIGIGLMGLTSSGTKKNVVREDITQATEEAEKGMQHITLEIQKRLEEKIPAPTIGNGSAQLLTDQFNVDFDVILAEYVCPIPPNVSNVYYQDNTQHVSYSTCLDNDSYSKYVGLTTPSNTLRELKFISTGTADGETKVITSVYRMGAKYLNYPDFMNYAVATHTTVKADNTVDKVGHLFLNGGIEIKGDVRADGNMIISDLGYAPTFLNLSFNPWIESVYPAIIGPSAFPPSTSGEAKLFINPEKKLFTMVNEKIELGCTRPSYLVGTLDTLLVDLLGPLQGFLGADLLTLKLGILDYITYYDLVNYNFDDGSSSCLFEAHPTSEVHNYLSTDHKPDLIKTSKFVDSMNVENLVSEGKSNLNSAVVKSSYEPFVVEIPNLLDLLDAVREAVGLLNRILDIAPNLPIVSSLLDSLELVLAISNVYEYPLTGSMDVDTPTELKYGIQSSTEDSPHVTGDYLVSLSSILYKSNYQLGVTSEGNTKGNFYFNNTNLSLIEGQNTLKGNYYFENNIAEFGLNDVISGLNEIVTELEGVKNLLNNVSGLLSNFFDDLTDQLGFVGALLKILLNPIIDLLEVTLDLVGNLIGAVLGTTGSLLDVLNNLIDDLEYLLENLSMENATIWLHNGNHTLDGQFYAKQPSGNNASAMKISGGEHTIKGIYYLDGDLNIDNSTIKADAVFYVNGDVTIDRTNISSADGSEDGKLIIFAKGNISYNYASDLAAILDKDYYHEHQLDLDAYFYAGNKLELHGTLSNIKINGGVAANKVLLTGVRGEVETDPIEFESANSQEGEPSRLVIEYDKDVILKLQKIYDKYNLHVQYNEIEPQPIYEISREIN